jgi:hypothetical protein
MQKRDGRDHTPQFFIGPDLIGSRAGALASYIQYIRSIPDHFRRRLTDEILAHGTASAIKGIGCDIDDAHYERVVRGE